MAAVRLADLLAGLSRMADLGFGLPVETALRSCALATRLARLVGLPEAAVRTTFYTALLHHVGCVGYAHETARLFGDDLAANTAAGRTDPASSRDMRTTFLPVLGQGKGPVDRARLAFLALTQGARWGDRYTTAACEVGRDTARRLGLPTDIQTSLFHVYDLSQDSSRPGGRSRDDIPVASRIAQLSAVAALFDSIGGSAVAVRAVRRRAGGMLDPSLVARFTDRAGAWLAAIADTDVRRDVLEREPRPHLTVPDPCVVATVFGDLADLKSPYLPGHARAVAGLARDAAQQLGLPDAVRADLEIAGLVHDLGRVAVSSGVWDKPGRLTADEWEQVRLHAYHSERILAGSAELARLVPLVGRHHERLDGSGYHRGCDGGDLSMAARILAAADTYRALTEPRPHRAALDPDQASGCLLDEVRTGALDTDAARGVLAAAGRAGPPAVRTLPHGLSDREAEVLRLVAQGCSNAEIASRLVISRRTAEHHVQHIYAKLGTSSRAAAALFAVDHHLLGR